MTLNENEAIQARLLVEFIAVCKDGLVKPYDPSPILSKLNKLEKRGIDVSGMKGCCPPTSEIRDAKDLKPIILGAAERFAEIMGIKKVEGNYGDSDYH